MDAARALSPDEWARLSPRLDELLDLPEAERGARLQALREQSPTLAARLAELLAGHDTPTLAGLAPGFAAKAALAEGADAALAGRCVGAWRLERPLGAGGMGSVWLARRNDGRFDGVAAVKLPHLALLGPDGQRRFAREAQALARLTHPHIPALHDAGVTAEGQPYLVLEHVAGGPIDQHCDQRRLGPRDRVGLVLQMLDAVAHAHARLVLHRDLKPGNVLVTDDGQVKLVDFGIAQWLAEADTGAAQPSQQLLTPDFAAPEQLQAGPIGTATDVYAAGVLLYLLLAGVHPFAAAGATPAERLRSALDHDPAPLPEAALRAGADAAACRGLQPAALAAALRGDLAAIVAKALRRSPAERYPDARALADDLRRHLAHQPVQARPAGHAYRAARFARRHRAGVAAAAVVAGTLLAGAAGTAWQARRAAQERDVALQLSQRNAALVEFFESMLTQAAQGERPVTVPALVQRSRAIALHGGGDAATDASVLLMLADLTVTLDDPAGAQALLDDAARRLRAAPGAEPALGARWACAQAFVASKQGRRDEALQGFAQALPQAADPLTRADCLLRRAWVAQNHNDAAGALADAQQALALVRATPGASPLREAQALGNVAYGHHLAGQPAEADALFAQTLARMRALGRGDTPDMVTFLNNRGIAAFASGDVQGARRSYDEALAVAAQLAPDAPPPFYLLRNRAVAELDLGLLDAALADFRRAQDDAQAQGNTMNAGLAALGVATTQLERGERAAALQAAADARRAFGPALAPDGMHALSLQQFHAREALAAGRLEEAAAGATRIVGFFDQRGMEVAPLVSALRLRAEVHWRSGRFDAAEADLARALPIARRLAGGQPASSLLARTLWAQQRLRAARGHESEAREGAAQAAQALALALGPTHPETLAARALAASP